MPPVPAATSAVPDRTPRSTAAPPGLGVRNSGLHCPHSSAARNTSNNGEHHSEYPRPRSVLPRAGPIRISRYKRHNKNTPRHPRRNHTVPSPQPPSSGARSSATTMHTTWRRLGIWFLHRMCRRQSCCVVVGPSAHRARLIWSDVATAPQNFTAWRAITCVEDLPPFGAVARRSFASTAITHLSPLTLAFERPADCPPLPTLSPK